MRNNKKNKLLIILIVTITLLLAMAIYLTFFQMFKSSFYADHNLNSRNFTDEQKVIRGNILDRNGKILTYSEKNSTGKHIRYNNYDYLYTPIIGYSSNRYGRSGIEAKYNKELLNIASNEDFIGKLKSSYDQKLRGNDVRLTIDNQVQSYIYDLMGNKKGACIVIDPKTGEIISMVSKPTFNVNKVDENWDDLTKDTNGIMINRATQGLYPPGSIFKIFSSILILENDIDQDFDDQGFVKIDGFEVNNLNKKAYGKINLQEALIYSSNAFFAKKSTLIATDTYYDLQKRMHLGTSFNFDIGTNVSKMVYSGGLSRLDKSMAAFGQGDNLVTPLDMAMMISTIANDGVLLKPRLVSEVKEENLSIYKKEEVLSKVTSPEIAKEIGKDLKATAEYNGYTIQNYDLAGKTGTAENASENPHSWYVGYGPYDNPKYAVAIVLENNGMAKPNAGDLYIKIMDFLLNYK